MVSPLNAQSEPRTTDPGIRKARDSILYSSNISKSMALPEYVQASPVCPSGKNSITVQKIMVYLCNDFDGRKPRNSSNEFSECYLIC